MSNTMFYVSKNIYLRTTIYYLVSIVPKKIKVLMIRSGCSRAVKAWGNCFWRLLLIESLFNLKFLLFWQVRVNHRLGLYAKPREIPLSIGNLCTLFSLFNHTRYRSHTTDRVFNIFQDLSWKTGLLYPCVQWCSNIKI